MAVYKSKNATKDGRQYFFRIKYRDIYDIVHDYTSPRFKKQKEAELAEAKYRIKLENGEISNTKLTLTTAFNELVEVKSRKLKHISIIRNHKMFEHLQPLHNIEINKLSLNHYRQLIQYLERKHLSADYKNKILGLFSQIIQHSKKYHGTKDSILIYIDKFYDHKIKEEMEFYTYEEYQQFDSVIDEFEYHVFFEILFYMGLRQGECQALTWNDINFNKEEISITKTLTTKIKGENWTITTPKTKNSIRVLPLPKQLLNDLKTMYNKVSCFNNFSKKWFIFGNLVPFKETTIQKKKNKYCYLAELKQIRIHDFRHSCATLLVNEGASLTLVSYWLGHSSINITLKVYAHLYKNELVDIKNMLSKLS